MLAAKILGKGTPVVPSGNPMKITIEVLDTMEGPLHEQFWQDVSGAVK
jgi:hypothetical protein